MKLSVTPNERVAFAVRYQDADLVVIDKPAGLVTQPGKGHARDSLLNGLFARWGAALQNLGVERDWGLLHRLDRDTSGLVLVGLRARAYDELRAAFAARRISKRYLALVLGIPATANGTIHQPLREVLRAGRKVARIARRGQPATTAWKIVATGENAALVEARPATGRLHQIRVHMEHLGHPVLGDSEYAAMYRMPRVPRLCLHAEALEFVHPVTHQRLRVTAELPEDFRRTAARLGISMGECDALRSIRG